MTGAARAWGTQVLAPHPLRGTVAKASTRAKPRGRRVDQAERDAVTAPPAARRRTQPKRSRREPITYVVEVAPGPSVPDPKVVAEVLRWLRARMLAPSPKAKR